MNTIATALAAQVSGRRVLVFGLGLQGGAKVANSLVELGASVRVTDRKNAEELAEAVSQLNPQIERNLGQESPVDIEWAEIIFKNPGVAYDHPLIQLAQENGKIVTTETAFALKSVRDRTIGITGTRGKTTTTTLIWHILKQTGKTVEIGGNIPQQPTLSTVLHAADDAWFVLELSSFQLEATDRERVSPHIGVLTSLSPDHLNRYKTMEQYVATKAALFRWQEAGDIALWREQPPEWEHIIDQMVPANVTRKRLSTEALNAPVIQHTLLTGDHNRNNVALACATAAALGVEDSQIARALATFTGVPYRQQSIPSSDGLTWINDTTATTPTALETALDTFQNEDFILITGGTTKQLPFSDILLEKVRQRVDHIIWLSGSGTTELLGKLNLTVPTHDSMSEAVASARTLAQTTGIKTILLSPGFSSFEHFTNEFDRGDQFNAAVQNSAHRTAS